MSSKILPSRTTSATLVSRQPLPSKAPPLPAVSLIVAMTPDRVIGRDGDLPWHLSADLKHFKATTMGQPVVMGRKTYDSIGRPLPGRPNIVVTHNSGLRIDGVTVVNSPEQGLEAAGNAAEIFIIGGARLYQTALEQADHLYVTWVLAKVDGDTFFPAVDWSEWRLLQRSAMQFEKNFAFYFAVYRRRRNPVD
ncbi:MAG: dihydrofolate reductase [Gammaproteobacteria bacterium]|nr:dihydrofolate reductase [Gammaproteobacteria bacterium]